ncbi:MAG: radical SAM protein, partial [Paludibacteraceae bacterium]
EEIIKRRLTLSFWGNIRFEKAYTPELCDLLSQAGCIAVSGGLEVASDRLLKLMNKGVTIQQTALAAHNLTQAGIMVHTYLMYGFPTETLQETINALDVVRQMFDQGMVQSAFWHRYAMTQHSQSGQHPDLFGVRRTTFGHNPFANNEVDFEEARSYDIEAAGEGLNLATYNYMHGIGLDEPLHRWFSIRTPKPQKIDILK